MDHKEYFRDETKTREFINWLKDRPELWQKKHRDFVNREIRGKMMLELENLTGMPADTCKKKLKHLKDKMRELSYKLPRTEDGEPDFDKGDQHIRWPYYNDMLFMKEEFINNREPTEDGVLDDRGDNNDPASPTLTISSVDTVPLDQYEEDRGLRSLPPAPHPIRLTSNICTPRSGYTTGVPMKAKRPRMSTEDLHVLHVSDSESETIKTETMRKLAPSLTSSFDEADECKDKEDEWHYFCSSIAWDLRKIKDPFLVLQVKSKINEVVNDGVLQQLHQDH